MLTDPDSSGVYARVTTSPARRGLALLIIYGLGGLVCYLAFNSAATSGGVIVLLLIAVAAFWAAEAMRRGAQGELQLTETALIHSNGTVLAELDQIETVSRGAFAAKPSNGFTLKLKEPAPRAWIPGFYWRTGRRVGVGGVVSAGAARFMAEQIAMQVAQRTAR